MLYRARVTRADHVVVTGASGGVGSAAVQLAKRRGATVTGVAARGKSEQVRELGAGHVVDRDDDIVTALGQRSVDVVIDNVSGPAFGGLLGHPQAGRQVRLVRGHRRPGRDARQAHLLPQ